MYNQIKQRLARAWTTMLSVAVIAICTLPAVTQAATKFKIEAEVTAEANAATKTEAIKASPTITLVAGTNASFVISTADKTDRLRVSVKAAEPEGETVALELKIEMRQTDGNYTTSTSKVKATLGTATSMALETDTGAEVELSLKVSKAP